MDGAQVSQLASSLILTVPVYDDVGGIVSGGTVTAYLAEVQSDGTLFSYDFNDNTFKSGALTTATASLTHRKLNNSTVNSGIWTYVLSTVTDFNIDGVYVFYLTASLGYPAATHVPFVWKPGLTTQARADVNAEVVDALATDTYAEPGQATPAATASLASKLNYLYKAWRNKKDQTATLYQLYNDDTTTVGQKASVSDSGGTTTVGEVATGP